MASLVELEPAPAITGTRPLASSTHHSTTRLCSSWLTVGLSPVVPTGTRPWVPSAICQPTSDRKAASSSEPFLNGVTRAVKDPRNFVLAAMDFLQTLVYGASFIGRVNSYRVWRPGERPRHRSKPRFCRGPGADTCARARNKYLARIFNQIDLKLKRSNDSP